MKLVSVVGARPQLIKASAFSRVARECAREVLVHTGQHYDADMSDVFFRDLDIPAPDHYLGVGSGSHAQQTAALLTALEPVLVEERPDVVVVFGDTNSTMAAAVVAAKLGLRIAHIEAGLRSFVRTMPEEINRVVSDHLATWLFAPSQSAADQLAREGITEGVHVVGDIMLDVVRQYRERAAASRYPDALGVRAGDYYLCTIHRAENVDDAATLRRLIEALNALDRPVIVPLHPRTRKRFAEFGVQTGDNVRVIDPVGYLDMLQLQQASRCVLTDSGGVQKEAYYVGVPCITLREETEWTETVAAGWNCLAGTDPSAIRAAVASLDRRRPASSQLYGDGYTAERIVRVLTASAH
jgi:UDP-GlcNAc3NAcA epimerase